MNFPEIGPAHTDDKLIPRKLKFRKNTGRVFQKSGCVIPRKIEISEKNLITKKVFQDLPITAKRQITLFYANNSSKITFFLKKVLFRFKSLKVLF